RQKNGSHERGYLKGVARRGAMSRMESEKGKALYLSEELRLSRDRNLPECRCGQSLDLKLSALPCALC
ncbi:mCG144656, partial [Mus musculus]